MSEGADRLDALKSAGFSDADISAWQADRTKALLDGGFSQEDVAKYWGAKKFDTTEVRKRFEQNLAPLKDKPNLSFGDYLDAGWQMSVTGLVKRQKLPDVLMPQDAPMWGRIAYNIAQMAGDLPASIAGAMAGGSIGATAGGAAGGAVGTAIPGAGTAAGAEVGAQAGAYLGGGYGAMFVPAFVRRSLINGYENGSVKSFGDLWPALSSAFLEGHHAGEVGALTAGMGKVVGAAAAPVMSPVAAKSLQMASEVTTMVTAGKAIEGQIPTLQDFADAAVLVGGMHLATLGANQIKIQTNRIVQKLGNNYAATGIRPEEVVADAANDPVIRQEVASDNIDVPSKYATQVDPEGVMTPAREPVKVSGAMTKQAAPLQESSPTGVAVEKVTGIPATQRGGPKATTAEITEEQPTPQDTVLARIAMEDVAKKPVTLSKLYTALVDDLHPIKQLTRLLAGEEPLSVKDDPYQLARLTRGATGKADHFLEFSPVKFDTLENVGKPLSKILEPVRDDLDGLRAYAVSKRALELQERGIETGVPLEAAKQTVAEGTARFEPVFRELQDYQRYTLQYLRDSGILSAEALDRMAESNKDYVPFYRLMDENGTSGPASAGKGLSVRQPVKGIKGSERMIVDPLESIIKNTYLYVQLAERNRALTALANLADGAGERGAELMQRVPAGMRPITVSEPEIAKFMSENGVEGTAGEMTVFRPKSSPLANDEIAVYRDGVREVYKVSPEVATAVRALDKESTSLAVKLAAIPARALRAGTTLSPEFVARNFIRDQMTAFNLGEKGFIPVYDTLRGLGSLFAKDEDYQSWLKSGGANSALVSLDRNYIEQNVFKLEKDTGLMSKTWNVLKSPLEILRATSEAIENSTRLGEYKRLTKGETDLETIMEGGMGAREVTLDFQRIGARTRAMNMIVAFWNAHAQGLDKTARAFIDRPMETAFKLGVSVTLPSVLLWFANKDDPRWKEVPQWQKDLFWIFMTKEHIYRIPKPMELGIIFGSIPERVLDSYHTDNPRAFKNLGDSLMQAFTPSYIPTFAVPIVEQFANRSTFTGNPIIPQGMEGILPEYQYTEYSTEAGKILGKLVAAVPGAKDSSFSSPMVLENYIRAWSGQLGMYALKVADQALITSGAVPDPVKPASSLADIPVIKAFVVRYPSASAQSIQDFYDNYDKVNRRLTTVKYLAKQGDISAALELMKSQQSEQGMILLTGIKDALATQTKFIHLVAKNPDIKPEEKRQIIDGVYYRMIEAARQGNEMVDQLSKIQSQQVAPKQEPEFTGESIGSGPRLH